MNYPRQLQKPLLERLDFYPGMVLLGPRQSGKTTLARQLAATRPDALVLDLERAGDRAALAEPERTVVCFTGDGSLKMNIQEMATLADEGANVKIVLMNNQSLGMVHQQQDMFYKRRLFAVDYKRRTDFVRIAQGFGLDAVDLDTSDNPRGALHDALRRRGPCLIHCSTNADAKVVPMVPPGAANTEMIGG